MIAAYVTVTAVAILFNGAAAVTYLSGHEYPKRQADMKRVPRRWVPVLGSLLAAGALGLAAGFVVPPLGIAAAAGLTLYFIGALIAHTRVRSRALLGPSIFLLTALTTLVLSVLHHL